ncbi:hypothetical protein [Sphingomonas sp. CFBP 8760]|uniref:hypothetical protein n=1 Tax=Sphingomonas sp. CFBP 8760 TaxID=2775282 RepID=UPI001780839B|nr:hypothetical protein [Sphingomonas sp. CFBP 8760]MBD8546104.1 hypothetical protein [Sphingomonas sp. CFBP 8760]
MPAQPANVRGRPRIQGSPRASVVDLQHVVRIWTDQQIKTGKVTATKANEFWQKHGSNYLEKIKSYFPIGKDIKEGAATLRLIASELGIMGRYYIKEYRGRPHIIFKGHAGARQFLTGTRYGIQHHKIISLKMTTAGMKAAAKGALVFGILFCTVIDVVNYMTNDRATLGQLFGSIGVDIAKCLIATGAAFATGVGMATLMGTAVVAIGPVVIALFVGVGLSVLLDILDNHFGVTKKLSELCDTGLAKLKNMASDLADSGTATWQQIENSEIVHDLSREAGEWSDWIADRASRVTWHRGWL